MRKEYDFSNARRSPWAARPKQPVTIRLDGGTVRYFKEMAAETAMPYQSLINLYLLECAATKKKLHWGWKRQARTAKKVKTKREKGGSRR